MSKSIVLAMVGSLLVAGTALAQVGSGGLPPQAQRDMETKRRDLENKSLLVTDESMADQFGEEELTAFLDGAVVRLILFPSGKYEVYSLPGGEVISFKLGKKRVDTDQEGAWEDDWLRKSGEYGIVKRSQDLSLTLSAGPQKMTVPCFNQYGRKDGIVTFYVGVGPSDAMLCLGLPEEEEKAG